MPGASVAARRHGRWDGSAPRFWVLAATSLLAISCLSERSNGGPATAPRERSASAEEGTPGAPTSGLPLTILLPPGTKVRVDAPSLLSSQLVGQVLALRSDTLEVTGRVATPTAKSATWTGPVPLSAIGNLERSSGSKGHGLIGMGIGLLVGALIAPTVFNSSSTSNSEIPDYSPILFGIGGVILGGIIGAQFRTEKWEKVQVAPMSFGM